MADELTISEVPTPSTPGEPWKRHRDRPPAGLDPLQEEFWRAEHRRKHPGLPLGCYGSPDAQGDCATEPAEPDPDATASRVARERAALQARAGAREFLATLPGHTPAIEQAEGLLARAHQQAAERVKAAVAAATAEYDQTDAAGRLARLRAAHDGAAEAARKTKEDVEAARDRWRQAVAQGDTAATARGWAQVAKAEDAAGTAARGLGELAPHLADAQAAADAARDDALRRHLRQVRDEATVRLQEVRAAAAVAAASHFEAAEAERAAVAEALAELRRLLPRQV
jgi:hypothetical protein